ncbi:hypothetical protein COX58_01170 [archaeon CG_4_10_14_0_2_um_filter_Archaea_38_6]|nr:MAG: hypothetical protein COS64_03120 [archaeon CG06_land_8_20_14_3_00_37_11]PJA22801.1 MAG: hypothetical protein COX58_01170 [archaeon CG_4_10_14_0_2_um_filter_Archaea_38_6]
MITESEKTKILTKARAKDPELFGADWPAQYKIIVNTPFQSIGKYYNMVLKELREFGFKNLTKVNQALSASPTSAFYADVAQRKAYAKEQFDKGQGLINGIIQQVMKLIYSLKEFDLILDIFKRLESSDDSEKLAAELNLRRIWLDEVDVKKGRGSIHTISTAQGMEFVSLRDSFLVIKDLRSIDELTVNDRVKRILKDRFSEYSDWKKAYKKDIEGRKKIQKEYLRNQVESLKMQLEWVKPYYTLMQQLEIDTGVANPDLLAGVDTNIIKTKIRGVIGGEENNSLATAFLDVDFYFKTSPVQVTGEQGRAFHHRFMTEITYTPYVMSNDEYNKIFEKEVMKDIDFLKEVVGKSLEAIKDDLDKYLAGGDIKEEEKKPREMMPFEFLILPFKPLFSGFGSMLTPKKKDGMEFSSYKLKNDLKTLNDKIVGLGFKVYENFKDEVGFLTWSATLA